MKALSDTAVVGLFANAGPGTTVTRPRTSDPEARGELDGDFTAVLGAGARAVFANRATLQLDVRDTMLPGEGLYTLLTVPRIGIGIAF